MANVLEDFGSRYFERS